MTSNSQNLKFEDIQTNTIYSITLNPDNAFQYFGEQNRLITWYNKIKQWLNITIKNTAYMEMMPEVSPHGRLHLHGYIKIIDKISFYVDIIHILEQHFQLEIDEIDINTGKNWDEYIIKQSDLHKYLIQHDIAIPLKIGHDFKQMTKQFFTNY